MTEFHVNNKMCVGGDECDCLTCQKYGRIALIGYEEAVSRDERDRRLTAVMRAERLSNRSPAQRRAAREAEKRRAEQFKTALTTITAILDEVESDRLENNVDIDVDELIAGIRKQLRNAWGL